MKVQENQDMDLEAMNVVIDQEMQKTQRISNPSQVADSVMAFRSSAKFGVHTITV